MTLEIGTDHQGAFAQTGTSRGEPARPIAPDDVLEAIADVVGDYILEGLL